MGYWDKGERQLSTAVETLAERIFIITSWRTFCVSRSRLKFILSFSLGWSNTIKLLLFLGNLSQLENQSRVDAKSWRRTMYKSRWVQWSLNKGIDEEGAWQQQKPSDVSGVASERDERNVSYLVLNGQIPDMLTMAGIGVGDPPVPPLFHYHSLRVRSLDEQACDWILPRLISLLQKTGSDSERTLPFALDFFIHMDHRHCQHLFLFKEKRKTKKKDTYIGINITQY